MSPTARQIYQAVLAADTILLIPHQHPDGDALGSLAAFREWLLSIKKKPVIYCATPAAERFHYLPGVELVGPHQHHWQTAFDLIIVFDSGDLRYAGVADLILALETKPPIVNIDHHVTNEQYGDFNLVDSRASSTSEVLYRFFAANQIPLSGSMATALLTGLMTDTDQFTNGATSPTALAVGSALLRRGGDLGSVQSFNFNDKSVATLQVWGAVLSRLDRHPELDIVHTYLTLDDLRSANIPDTQAEGIANFLNSLNEGRASLILKELPDGTVKGSFRTTRSDVDVASYAKRLGGGGHRKAAGFVTQGPIAAALEKIFSTIIETATVETAEV